MSYSISTSVAAVSDLLALVALSPNWSAAADSDTLDFSYNGVGVFSLWAGAGFELDNLLDAACLDDLSTLSVFPAGCFCGGEVCGCACPSCEADGSECDNCDGNGEQRWGCDSFECEGAPVACNRCDFEAADRFVYAGISDADDPYRFQAYDLSDALDFARRYAVGVSYDVAPIVGELILDALRSSGSSLPVNPGKWVGLWSDDEGAAVCLSRYSYTIDVGDLSRVSFVGGSAYSYLDAGADLMDADTLAAFVEWVSGNGLGACPLAAMALTV